MVVFSTKCVRFVRKIDGLSMLHKSRTLNSSRYKKIKRHTRLDTITYNGRSQIVYRSSEYRFGKIILKNRTSYNKLLEFQLFDTDFIQKRI